MTFRCQTCGGKTQVVRTTAQPAIVKRNVVCMACSNAIQTVEVPSEFFRQMFQALEHQWRRSERQLPSIDDMNSFLKNKWIDYDENARVADANIYGGLAPPVVPSYLQGTPFETRATANTSVVAARMVDDGPSYADADEQESYAPSAPASPAPSTTIAPSDAPSIAAFIPNMTPAEVMAWGEALETLIKTGERSVESMSTDENAARLEFMLQSVLPK